jgi:DNA-binding beta-propeller fold protein YncE
MHRCRAVVGSVVVVVLVATTTSQSPLAAAEAGAARGARRSAPAVLAAYRSPFDLALVGSRWIVTANATGDSVSLIDRAAGRAVDERPVGARPTSVAAVGADALLVVASEAGDVVRLEVRGDRLVESGRLHVGFEPRGVAVSADGSVAFVTLALGERLVMFDPVSLALLETIEVGRLPRGVAVSPDGKTVAVACSAGAEIVVVDVAARAVRSRHRFHGINLGDVRFSASGGTVFFAWTYDAGSHPSPGNIRRGWVTGSRLGRLDLGGTAGDQGAGDAAGAAVEDTLRGLTLDVSGQAVGDVAGLALVEGEGATADGAGPGRRILITAGGTHELVWLRDPDAVGPDDARQSTDRPLPYTQISGSEVMDRGLAVDRGRFRRVELGGRPLGIRVAADARRAFVANYLLDAVQEVDLNTLEIVRTIELDGGPNGGAAGDVALDAHTAALVRRGEAIFLDARRSLDQWYSCHTCHFEGGGNTVTMDTLNDGSSGTHKTVLPLYRLADTGPWTWHGWQTDLEASLEKSLVETMQGPAPTAEDVDAMAAYLSALEPPPNPFREAADTGSAEAARGRDLFHSARAGCSDCHGGPLFTSDAVYDVGLGKPDDRYRGHSAPALAGVSRKTLFLHHGRAKSLEQVLTGLHSPERAAGLEPLSADEVRDLVAYLRTL